MTQPLHIGFPTRALPRYVHTDKGRQRQTETTETNTKTEPETETEREIERERETERGTDAATPDRHGNKLGVAPGGLKIMACPLSAS